MQQIIDPDVSRLKFAAQVETFRANSDMHARRGCFMYKAEFPCVHLLFCTQNYKPRYCVFAVRIDFTNYDFYPPSIVLIDPVENKELTSAEAPVPFARQIVSPSGQTQIQRYLQTHGPDKIPFFCVPGVREYHGNPGHSADHWLNHRNTGEGTLNALTDLLFTYGTKGITGPNLELVIKQSGFAIQLQP